MGIKTQMKTLDLLKKLVAGEINTVSYIEQKPQKIIMNEDFGSIYFQRATPESQGISSAYLMNFIKALESNEHVQCHGIMIIRNQKVIMEGSFAPYSNHRPQITHSIAKSIVGIAIGIAHDEGLIDIDESVGSIFGKQYLPIIGKRNRDITIRHLLTMSSGVSFNEIGSIIEEDWLKEYLQSGVMFDPGSQFAYNSMNSYILSAIIKEKSGQGLMEYLKPRLFEPLGITNIFWECCPKSIEKGGWGFYIDVEDRAKIAQLLLNKGVWEGKQILSKEYIREMTKKQMDTPVEQNKYGYGYQLWMGNRKDSFLFNGVLGQNVIVYPDINMIISITSGNSELFVSSALMNVIEEFFGENIFKPKDSMKENSMDYFKLRHMLKQLSIEPLLKTNQTKGFFKHSYGGGWPKKRRRVFNSPLFSTRPCDEKDIICAHEYFVKNSDASIVPLFIQCMQNNFSKGIDNLHFTMIKGNLYINIQEGDQIFHVPIGFVKPEFCTISLNGEPYEIGTSGILIRNEDNVLVLKVTFSFIEMTNSRIMKFFFCKDKLTVQFYETPDLQQVVDDAIPFLKFSIPSNGVDAIRNLDIIQYKLSKMLAPQFEMDIKYK